MMRIKKDWLRKGQHVLLLATATFPLCIGLTTVIHQEWLPFVPLLPAVYALLALLCLLVPGRWRLPAGIACVVLAAVAAGSLLPMEQWPMAAVLLLCYGAMLLATLPIAGWHLEEELPVYVPIGGTVTYVLLQIAINNARRTGQMHFEPIRGWVILFFLLFGMLTLLSMNRISLAKAAHYRVAVPARMQRQNLFLTIGLFVLVTLLAGIPAIGRWLTQAWNSLIGALKAFAAWVTSLFVREGGGAPAGGDGGMGAIPFAMEEAAEQTLFQQIAERILLVLALLVFAVIVIALLIKIGKLLRRGILWLWQQMNRFSNAISKDYVDEITDTRDDAQTERTGFFKGWRSRLRTVDESRLTPSQRVRYRYLRLRMKHPEWTQASTARETLPNEAARLYERARYGLQQLTEEEAKAFDTASRRG